MRSPRWLISSLLLVPSLASAQVFVPPPPPHVYIQQRIHWHLRRAAPPPPMYAAPVQAPVWVAPTMPPPPVYYTQPPAPLVHIEPQQPIYVQPQPTYQSPCCTQAAPAYAPNWQQQPAPPVVQAPVVLAAPRPAKPQWDSRFGLGVSVEGLFNKAGESARGYGLAGQLRYRTSRHTALELMGGYQGSTMANGLQRSDAPFTFGLLVPFLGPEHSFSPYLVGAVGINFARLRLVDSPDFTLDDSRLQSVAQLGGGFEIRLSQRFSLNADARFEGRWNLGQPSAQVANSVVKVDGELVDPLKNSVGARLGLGATVYF